MKIPTFCTVTSLVGLALSSNPSLESTRVHQVLQEHQGVVCVPDLLAEGAVMGTEAHLALDEAVDKDHDPLPEQPRDAADDLAQREFGAIE